MDLYVLEYHLLTRLHAAVLAELAAPTEKVGGENDGGTMVAFLGHAMNLSEVGFYHLVSQKVFRKLK